MKTETKHTPGPWVVEDTMVYCDDYMGSRVADCRMGKTILTQEECDANAKLIAAAPENIQLDLEFQIEILPRILEIINNHADLVLRGDMADWIVRKRNIIKKVTE